MSETKLTKSTSMWRGSTLHGVQQWRTIEPKLRTLLPGTASEFHRHINLKQSNFKCTQKKWLICRPRIYVLTIFVGADLGLFVRGSNYRYMPTYIFNQFYEGAHEIADFFILRRQPQDPSVLFPWVVCKSILLLIRCDLWL